MRFSASVGAVFFLLYPCFRICVLLACGVLGLRWLRCWCSLRHPLIVGSAYAVTACPAPALALQGVWSQSVVPSLLLLFVEIPWGLFGILSPWPLVAPYPSVISRLGFFLWRLFRLGFEVLRSWLWILPSFGGALFPLSLLF